MTPISESAALKRIAQAGLTLEQTFTMSDTELLRYPSIGRRTLQYIRENNPNRPYYVLLEKPD